MSVSVQKDIIPDKWRTKIWCYSCMEYFPLKYIDDHYECSSPGAPVCPVKLQLCELFTNDEYFGRLEVKSAVGLESVDLVSHECEGYFYGRAKFIWVRPIVWAPRWAIAIADDAHIEDSDKAVVIPLMSRDSEIRSALDSLMVLAEHQDRAKVVRRFVRDLVDDFRVAQIVTHADVD